MFHEALAMDALPSYKPDLESVTSPDGDLYASNGVMYRSMFFVRDATEAADDLLRVRPELAKSAIIKISSLLGSEYNPDNAEEYGRAPHQEAHITEKMSDSTKEQVRKLSDRWGGNGDGFVYYGSLDSTPLYARLVARYSLVHGTGLLDYPIVNKRGERTNVYESLKASLGWITDHLESSELNLLEFKRLSNDHLIIQNWTDSGSGFVHENGERANVDGFIAPIEIQGYAYDALKLAAEVGKLVGDSEAQTWADYANRLQENIVNRFWMPDRNQFAMGIDRDENWQPRLIKTSSSNQGVLMDSRLLMDFPEEQREVYLSGIIEEMFSDDYLTDVGLRTRALRHADITGFADYHGSLTSWPKQTYDVSKGLRRQGSELLARQLEMRLLNGLNISGQHYEFWYVNKQGEVAYVPVPYCPGMHPDEIIVATNIPDTSQAWTIAAAGAIKNWKKAQPKHSAPRYPWMEQLERSILSQAEFVHVLNRHEVMEKRRNQKRFAIDIQAGIEADRRWNPDWWK